jgi:large subunit ribosomal protein L25
MALHTISAEKRDSSGKSPTARRVRQLRRVPGVMYRSGSEPVSFSVDELELNALVRKGATLVEVDLEGTKHTTLLKDHQVHGLKGSILHVDLQEVRMDEKIRTVVPVVITGNAPGVKAGGLLTVATHELNIECTPNAIPDDITVDVSALDVSDYITVADLQLPEGVVVVDDPSATVVVVSQTRATRGAGRSAAENAAFADAADAADDAADGVPAAPDAVSEG